MDLDPRDGVTPWVEFATGLNSLVTFDGTTVGGTTTATYKAHSGSAFGGLSFDGSVGTSSGGGSISGDPFTEEGMTLSATASASGAGSAAIADASISDPYASHYLAFLLSPHTELIASGDVFGTTDSGPPDSNGYVLAGTGIAFFTNGEQTSFTGGGSESGPSRVIPVSVTFTNGADDGTEGEFFALADVRIENYLTPVEPPPPVPEVANVVLMLAGLGFVALKRRKSFLQGAKRNAWRIGAFRLG